MTGAFGRLAAALADRYRIERELGQGGMATVYLAQDLKHDRKVAVKVLRPELAAVIGAERFLAEIKVTANLQHPNLLPLFDSGEAGKRGSGEASYLYYVMPYVEGETLRARLERERQLPVDEVVRIVTLLANALDYAHAHGVIHRDLKPENILLAAGQPVIADFGIALAVAQAGGSRVTETGLSLGTPYYMSPEQAAGERNLDAKSDQYALGAVTYEMLSGEPPHSGPTAQVIIARLMTEKPRSLQATRPGIPRTLDLAVARALSKPAADRFPDCGAFARALSPSPARAAPARRLIIAAGVGLLLVAAVLLARRFTTAKAGAASGNDNTVAVMLFDNVTRDTMYAYLADGLAAEIATTLGRVPRLEVRSPGAVRSAQRGIDPDPVEVGRRLNVRNVVEGDYQRGGDRIRVSVRLVSLPSGTQRWSESYTRPAADLLAVQEEIARAVVVAIAGQLLPQERSVLAARPTTNPEAYDHFLRGNFQLARRTPASVARAIDEFSAALRMDSSFAQASARVGLGYALYLDWGWRFPGGVPADSQLARGMRAAELALKLDSTSSDGWMARGYLLGFRHPRTLDGVLEALKRATELEPTNAEAWHQYASWLTGAGEFDAGLVALRRAKAIEPGRAVSWLQEAQLLEIQHRDAEALKSYDSAIAVDPEFYAAYFQRTWLRLRAGDLTGARADAEAALRFSPPSEEYYGLAPMAAVAAYSGDTAAARQFMARAVIPYVGQPAPPLVVEVLAFGFTATGDRDSALAWIDRARPRGALMWWNMLFPALESLRGDPRFQRLLEANRSPGAREPSP
jgi:TolB-like protein/Tfp pilus assembly protein PilF